MPFVETYAVDFSLGNLHPHVNMFNWPDMEFTPSTQIENGYSSLDTSGLRLHISRAAVLPDGVVAGTSAMYGVYVVPPPLQPSQESRLVGGASSQLVTIPLQSRLLTRATFDEPLAIAYPQGILTDEGGVQSPEFSPSERAPSTPEPQQPATLSRRVPSDVVVSEPEPWAIGLHISPFDSLPIHPNNGMVNVTCQFNRQFNGVRVNTPTALQNDQAFMLDSPLDYNRYFGSSLYPDHTTLFTLEHSFCGSDAVAYPNGSPGTGHTIGAGSLKISRSWQAEVHDHRLYSSLVLDTTPPPNSIRALGVSIGTLLGVGEMRVRLRTFSVWLNLDSVS